MIIFNHSDNDYIFHNENGHFITKKKKKIKLCLKNSNFNNKISANHKSYIEMRYSWICCLKLGYAT